MIQLKRLLRSALTASRVPALFHPLTRGVAAVFMMHRFTDPETGVAGHDPAALRSNLAYLRRHGYRLASLDELLTALAGSEDTLYKTVVFTVDDGYYDFHSRAAAVFAEFDCPVTVFLPTGFIDGRTWLWWDRITFAFQESPRSSGALELPAARHRARWTDAAGRAAAAAELIALLKEVPDTTKNETIERLAEALEVELPLVPPAAYRPLTWDEVRHHADRGVTFGPHTVTHPILSRTTEAAAEWEITESWARLRAETDACLPVFCYPNGDEADFAEREISLVRKAGLRCSLSARHSYVSPALLADEHGRYALPRFPYHDDRRDLVQITSGIERLKSVLRNGLHPS